MGLDTVELTMAIEDEFGVAFLDADAAKLSRVGDIHSYVLRVLRERGETPDSEAILGAASCRGRGSAWSAPGGGHYIG